MTKKRRSWHTVALLKMAIIVFAACGDGASPNVGDSGTKETAVQPGNSCGEGRKKVGATCGYDCTGPEEAWCPQCGEVVVDEHCMCTPSGCGAIAACDTPGLAEAGDFCGEHWWCDRQCGIGLVCASPEDRCNDDVDWRRVCRKPEEVSPEGLAPTNLANCIEHDAGSLSLAYEDVVGLPAGDAEGSDFSADYFTEVGANPEIYTYESTCTSNLEALVSGVWVLQQSDGKLEIYARGGINTSCEGGIDSDGMFWCGAERSTDPSSRILLSGRISTTRTERKIEAEVTTSDAADKYGRPECRATATGRLTARL